MIKENSLVEKDGIEQALLSLNERLTSRALRIWKGDDSLPSQLRIYRGLEDLLDPSSIKQIRSAGTESRMTWNSFAMG